MLTYKIYVMTPSDHMSHDVSYDSGPSTSGAEDVRVCVDGKVEEGEITFDDGGFVCVGGGGGEGGGE